MQRHLYEEEHEWFRDTVREFVQRTLRPSAEQHRAKHAIGRDAWAAAGAQGLFALGVPEEFGGMGAADFRFNAVLGEELPKLALAYASSFGIHIDVVAPYLVELTDPEQQRRWLPKFVTGEAISAIGMTEPGAGSDLAALRTTAVPSDAGWVINGSKTFITNGSRADLVVVAARTGDGRRDISLFVVEAETPGFVHGAPLDKIGQPEADTSELFFEDAEIPRENLIGTLDRGFAHMMERLPQERLGSAVNNLAHAAHNFAVTLEYVRERKAFGRPIGTFQNSRFVIAEMSTRMDVAQAYVDRCVQAHVAGALSAVEAAKAKWWTARLQNDVLDACVQLHGGYGFMREYEVGRAWADARVTPVWAGSNEVMKDIIGRDLGLGDVRK